MVEFNRQFLNKNCYQYEVVKKAIKIAQKSSFLTNIVKKKLKDCFIIMSLSYFEFNKNIHVFKL